MTYLRCGRGAGAIVLGGMMDMMAPMLPWSMPDMAVRMMTLQMKSGPDFNVGFLSPMIDRHPIVVVVARAAGHGLADGRLLVESSYKWTLLGNADEIGALLNGIHYVAARSRPLGR